jgi:plastocyanin
MPIRLALALVLVLPTLAQAQQWGDLEGTFVFKGIAPTPKPLDVTKDIEVCGKHNLVDEALVVNKANGGLANVIVYLLAPAGQKVAVHPDYEKTAKAEVVIDNKNCRFEPRVQVLRVGQTLVLGNKDPVGHNTKADFFNAQNTPFNDLIPSGGAVKKALAGAEGTPVKLQCNIHPWMLSWLVLRDDPYVGVSDKDGKLTIKNLPVGEHTFIVYSEKYLSDVTVNGKPTTWARGRVKVAIKPGMNSLGKVEYAPK